MELIMKLTTEFCTVFTALSLLLFVSGASVASAQNKGMGAHHPCAQDVEKFCSGVKPGGGRIKACLEQNLNNLSSMCEKRVTRMEQRQQQQEQEPPPGAGIK